MQLFFTTAINNNTLTLSGEESNHCTRVLRKKTGDSITATDGAGNLYTARLSNIGKDFCEAEIESTQTFLPAPHLLHVAVAPTKNTDRTEWMVEKLVEIGVAQITPINCAHSERRVQKTDRLKKIALAAMKQSLKYHLPVVNELVDFKTFISQPRTAHNLVMGYCETEQTEHILLQPFTHAQTIILIGPEGDFAPQEVALAKAAGFVPVSLGQSRLRTETAAIVAATLLNTKFETQHV